MTCDDCGVRVSPTGHLGGPIVCKDCAEEIKEKYA